MNNPPAARMQLQLMNKLRSTLVISKGRCPSQVALTGMLLLGTVLDEVPCDLAE